MAKPVTEKNSRPLLVRSRMSRAQLTLSLACWIVLTCGCAQWNSSSPVKKNWLAPPKMASDGALFEIAVVDVGDGAAGVEEELWREADEQFLPTEVRRRLAAAGIRCGSLGSQIPESIRKWLESQQTSVALDEKDGAAVLSDVPTQRRLQCRAGRPQFILACKPRPKLVVTNRVDGEATSEEFQDAACELRLKANPQGDGRVRLEVVAGIRHGNPRQRWVGDQGLFRLDNNRECRFFDDTKVEATLVPGQTLLWTAAAEEKGIGQAFFADDQAAGLRRKIILVRLAQTKLDDLFAPQHASTPIITPGP